jgi:hypothetical protein
LRFIGIDGWNLDRRASAFFALQQIATQNLADAKPGALGEVGYCSGMGIRSASALVEPARIGPASAKS